MYRRKWFGKSSGRGKFFLRETGFEGITGGQVHKMVCKTAAKEVRNMHEESRESKERTGGDVDDYIFTTEQDWLISDR